MLTLIMQEILTTKGLLQVTVSNCTINKRSLTAKTQAEYTAKTQASKEAIWLKGILKQLRYFQL